MVEKAIVKRRKAKEKENNEIELRRLELDFFFRFYKFALLEMNNFRAFKINR